MKNGIEIEIIWFDQDVIALELRCSNGRFCGHAGIYAAHNWASDLATKLGGFPANPTDSRNIELGTFDPNYADGGVRMHFYCRDSAGHALADVKLRGDRCEAMGEVESVALRIPVEAAGIDSFVRNIRMIGTEVGGKAHLPIAK